MAGFGLIVGSGMADFGSEADSLPVDTPYGAASAALRRSAIAGRDVLVLPRHGDQHDIAPHRINYRANAHALAVHGVDRVISLNTVGVIPPDPVAGQLAVPSQLIDYTWGREHSVCDGKSGTLAHIDFTEPFSAALRQGLLDAAAHANVPCHDGGVYGATQGPRLETAAEIDRYERDGVTFVGMTAMPEVALARELDMEVACLSMIVNRAAGRGQGDIHGDIEASMAAARRAAMIVLEAFFGA